MSEKDVSFAESYFCAMMILAMQAETIMWVDVMALKFAQEEASDSDTGECYMYFIV